MHSRSWLPLVVVLALGLTGCGASSAREPSPPACGTIDSRVYPPGSTVDRLHRERRLRVGVKFDSPGVSYRDPDTGEMSGFDVEIAKVVACRLGVPDDRIEWVAAPNKNREKLIRTGAVDIVVASYVINEERRQLVSFAGPYYRDYQAVMVLTDETQISGPRTLKGRKVCAVTGSLSLQNIELYGAVGVALTDYSQCVALLLARKVEAVSAPSAILIGQLTLHPAEVKIVGEPLDDFPYGIGLAKTDANFRRFLDDVLEQSFTDGTWRHAYDQTLGRSGIGAPIPPVVHR
ncbi:MAG TPA: glutamate ABC transporter substrate-binding protein, partial [Mycobacteriales bacterium]|nr:glutamate ABC transporter substrate-binding protein [Mycobacteriales bacterium]